MTKLPASFKSYFWDVDFDQLDVDRDSFFILKRIIDKGNIEALRWAESVYFREQIKEVVLETRDLSRKSGYFWANVLSLDTTKVACLQKPYTQTPFGV